MREQGLIFVISQLERKNKIIIVYANLDPINCHGNDFLCFKQLRPRKLSSNFFRCMTVDEF